DLDAVGDFGMFPALRVDAPDLSLAPDHDRPIVRQPGVLRVHAVNRPRFLHVAIEAVEHRCLRAGLEVLHEQHGLQIDPPDEGEAPAVRRGQRRDRPTRPAQKPTLLAGSQVAAEDGVDDAVRILVVLERLAGRDVAAVVEVAAVGRDRGLTRILLPAIALSNLEPATTADVVHPYFAGAERALLDEMLAHVDVAPVRRPRRTV